LRKDNYHSTLKPEDFLRFGAFNEIVAPRRSRGEKSHEHRREKPSHHTGRNGPIIEKRSYMENWKDLPLVNGLDVPFLCFRHRVALRHFFVLPLLRKSRDETSFKGEGCNTLCYDFFNHLH
jgi:hypothetical protein